MSSEEIAVMRAVHHAYCHDTGCFDGDDISNPQITQALEEYAKMIERRVLAQQPCYCAEALATETRCAFHGSLCPCVTCKARQTQETSG